jgi:hypothetical protein
MTEQLVSLVFAVWTSLLGAQHAEDAPRIATAIVDAVAGDTGEPLTGSTRGDVALAAVYAFDESGLRRCAVGDHGRSLGAFQLQRLPASVACDPAVAAVEWLRRARQSFAICAELPVEERLSALVSGSCLGGRRLARYRWRRAAALLSRVSP